VRSYCWDEGRRWEKSDIAIWSVPAVIDVGSLKIALVSFLGRKEPKLLRRDEAAKTTVIYCSSLSHIATKV